MSNYITRAGDVVDHIAWKELGSEAWAIDILEANRWLAEYPAELPAGLTLTLPTTVTAQTAGTIRLWGSS